MDKAAHSEAKTYRDVARELGGRLRDGRIAPGAFFPREKELQIEFGVARTTIRRALQELVDGGAAEQVPYRGVRARGHEETRLPRTLAFIDGSTLVLGRMYADLSRRFLAEGEHLVHLDSQRMGLDGALAFAREKGYAGAFVWSFEGFPDISCLGAASAEMPIVLLDHGIRGFESDLVTFDNLQVGYDATAHLFDLGATRVALTGMLDMLDMTQDRLSGYLKACFAYDRQPSAADFVFLHTSGTAPCEYRALARRLADPDRPDAVLVMQDDVLADVVRIGTAAGLRIPEELRIMAAGDDMSVEVDGRALPAIQFDWADFSNHAFHLMRSRLSDRTGPPMRRVAAHRLVTSLPYHQDGASEPARILAHSQKRTHHAT